MTRWCSTTIDLIVEQGERIALVGHNGAGKSTLMRVLAGGEFQGGSCTAGHNVVLDYFAQDQAEAMDGSRTAYEELLADAPFDMVPQLRDILGAFLFSGDDIHKKVAVLSGGERNRLALAKMLLRPSNLLLMDEPTNHLDLFSKDVLLEALRILPARWSSSPMTATSSTAWRPGSSKWRRPAHLLSRRLRVLPGKEGGTGDSDRPGYRAGRRLPISCRCRSNRWYTSCAHHRLTRKQRG